MLREQLSFAVVFLLFYLSLYQLMITRSDKHSDNMIHAASLGVHSLRAIY